MVEKRFEKLGMPDIERFENYLPTAFNSELTLIQKVNKIIFDLMETNKLTNEMVDYLNNFIKVFDEKLYFNVGDILNKWYEDGFFNIIINDLIKTNITVSVAWFGAKGDNVSDDSEAIQRALDFAKNIENEEKQQGTVIYFPRTMTNKYVVTKNLVVHTNTQIVADNGVRLMRNAVNGEGFFVNGYQNKEYSIAGHNISIKNIIFDGNPCQCDVDDGVHGFGMIWFGKTKNITIENCTFLDVYSNHAIDIVDVDGLIIKNCKFLGFQDKTIDKNRGYAEAIQLSLHLENWGLVELKPYTYKGCRNVVIDGCEFGNSNRSCSISWNRAIGDHTGRFNVFNENITIKNCSFNGHAYGIFIPKWNNVNIHDNIFKKCVIDIHLRANLFGEGTSNDNEGLPREAQGMNDISIYNNNFYDTSYDNIQVWGAWNKTDETNVDEIAYNEHIVIQNNISRNTGGRFTHVKFNKNIKILNNSCFNVNFGLFHTYNKDLTFAYNIIEKIEGLGVYHDTTITKLSNDYVDGFSIVGNIFSDTKGGVISIPSTKNLTITHNQFNNVANTTPSSTLISLGNNINRGVVAYNNSDYRNKENITYGVYVGNDSTDVTISNNLLGGYWSDNYSTWKNVDVINSTSSGVNRYRIIKINDYRLLTIEYAIKNYQGGNFFPLPENIGLDKSRYFCNSVSGYSNSATLLTSTGLSISQDDETIPTADIYTGVVQYIVVS